MKTRFYINKLNSHIVKFVGIYDYGDNGLWHHYIDITSNIKRMVCAEDFALLYIKLKIISKLTKEIK